MAPAITENANTCKSVPYSPFHPHHIREQTPRRPTWGIRDGALTPQNNIAHRLYIKLPILYHYTVILLYAICFARLLISFMSMINWLLLPANMARPSALNSNRRPALIQLIKQSWSTNSSHPLPRIFLGISTPFFFIRGIFIISKIYKHRMTC